MLMVGFQGTTVPGSLKQLLEDPLVTGVIWFARNIESTAQVAQVNATLRGLRPDLLIAVDQEGGPVRRLREGVTAVPPMRSVNTEDEARRWGEILGAELHALGFNMNMAPVLDVDSNPDNPVIGQRSFDRDPAVVAQLGIALHEGLVAHGVASCGKHFPGHGDTDVDSHLDLPRLDHGLARLRAVELVPFRKAVAAGIPAIMSAHILLPQLDPDRPATLSSAALRGLLRDEVGFEGVVFTDDLEMNAIADHWTVEALVPACVTAGIDVLLICHALDKQQRALELLRARDDLDACMARINALATRFFWTG